LDSTKLTPKMKRALKKFVRANPQLTSVVCRGFTSRPASSRDQRLATVRGKVACNFIKSLRPDLEVKVLKGKHTDKFGQNIRRARIVMR